MNRRGITLIALVITIVVLIILASVMMGIIIGQNGLLNRTKQAKDDYLVGVNEEQDQLGQAGTLQSTRDVVAASNPVGTVIAYITGTSAPDGYLVCDGETYNIADYKDLADAIKNGFGSYDYWGGDGTVTFAVPNLQGEFLRGYTTAAANSKMSGAATENVGDHQEATQHPYMWTHASGRLYFPKIGGGPQNIDTSASEDNTGRYYGNSTQNNGWGQAIYYTSHPTNTSVLYCIKY